MPFHWSKHHSNVVPPMTRELLVGFWRNDVKKKATLGKVGSVGGGQPLGRTEVAEKCGVCFRPKLQKSHSSRRTTCCRAAECSVCLPETLQHADHTYTFLRKHQKWCRTHVRPVDGAILWTKTCARKTLPFSPGNWMQPLCACPFSKCYVFPVYVETKMGAFFKSLHLNPFL